MVDSAGLHVLSEQECFQLMAAAPVGRVVFTDRALPAIQPVTFVLHGQSVIIRTAERSRLALAATGAVVAFEVDEYEPVRGGWSVVAVGQARQVVDCAELACVQRLGLPPWAPSATEYYLRIAVEIISGRQFGTP